jgi:RNA polymerase sigma factor (sigma-70 family)
MDRSSWPAFLSELDSNPEGAFEQFYRLAFEVLTNMPPRPMRGLSKEDFQDLTHEIIYHCVKDGFRVLRGYKDKGKPFIAWLYSVAHNKALDFVRWKASRKDTIPIHKNSDGRGLENVLEDYSGDTATQVEFAELLGVVRDAMRKLGDYCRLPLEMAADEFTPREMVTVLRLPPDQNKKVSDDLRYCREKLKKRLAAAGVDIGSLT